MAHKKSRPSGDLKNILVRLNKAGEIIDVPEWLMETLRGFKMAWQCGLEVSMDDGTLRRFEACRVWHRSPFTDQPHKGGIRFHPHVNVDMMRPHAMEMSFKIWLMGINWGGAKGGVAVDPAKLSPSELKRLTEAYVEEMNERNILGPFRDVPAPDVGTNPTIMGWVRQCYARSRRAREDARFAGVVTGKPVGYGFDGIEGRTEATGYGVVHVLDRVLEHYPDALGSRGLARSTRIAVMGFGNVGSHVVRRAEERGAKIIAVSDVNGGVYAASGIDVDALIAHHGTKRSFEGFSGGQPITNAELLTLPDIDVLVPAALEHVITSENAAKVGARVIVEGANSPTTFDADRILEEKGILVIPDICANAGGVTVSFFEWARNVNIRDERVPAQNSKAAVIASMEQILTKGADDMCGNAKKYGTSLRLAAFVTALTNVVPIFKAKHSA